MANTKRFIRVAVIAAMFGALILFIAVASKPATKDYIAYWSAGQLLAQHSDPYAYAQVLDVERTVGYTPAKPIIMRNPPWALFLVRPLGWGNAVAGLIFWMAAGMGCVVIYLSLLKVAPDNRLFVYLFAPLIACLSSGQSSPFLLLGFVLFLHFNRTKPFLAGTALLLMAIKPHLFLVFWPILLVDCLYRHNIRLLAGGAVALIGASAYATYLDPHIWSQYLAMLHASNLDSEFLQTPAYILRYLVAPKTTWLQFVPAGAAMAWALWFYLRNRGEWDWAIHGMPLMLMTVLVSPYAWMSDEIVLLPSLMFALASPNKARHSTAIFVVINSVAIVMIMAQIQLSSGAYIWTSSAWFAWYLYSLHGKSIQPDGAVPKFSSTAAA